MDYTKPQKNKTNFVSFVFTSENTSFTTVWGLFSYLAIVFYSNYQQIQMVNLKVFTHLGIFYIHSTTAAKTQLLWDCMESYMYLS